MDIVVDLSTVLHGVKITKFQDRIESTLNDKLHRLHGPAIEFVKGDRRWYQNGKLHRPEGPAIEDVNGDKEWFQNGKCHRLDGPAVEYANGHKVWYQNGKRHRLNGPAIECPDGTKAWYLEGIKLSESEFITKTTRDTANKKLPINDTPIEVCAAKNSSVDEISTLQEKIKELELENGNLKITIKVISKVLTH